MNLTNSCYENAMLKSATLQAITAVDRLSYTLSQNKLLFQPKEYEVLFLKLRFSFISRTFALCQINFETSFYYYLNSNEGLVVQRNRSIDFLCKYIYVSLFFILK